MRTLIVNFLILVFSCYAYGGYEGYSVYARPLGFQHGKTLSVRARNHFPGGYGEGAYHGSTGNVHIALPGGGKAYSYSGGYNMRYGASYGHAAPTHYGGGGLGRAIGHNRGYGVSYSYGNPAVMKHALADLHQDILSNVHGAFGGNHHGGFLGGAPLPTY